MNNLALDPVQGGRAEDLKAELFSWHRPAELAWSAPGVNCAPRAN
jgi:hypothetical protein